jgi:tetratricopeptide (TPR) repeat protein
LKATAEARRHFELALGISRDLQDHRAEGQILGYLGLAHAREGQFAEARRCLMAGETLLRELVDPINQALLLCARAEAEQLSGRADDADHYLRMAESLAQRTGPSPDSELGIALSRVRAVLAAA